MTGSTALAQRAGLPDALRVLAEAFPRAEWEAHSNFRDMVQFWMQRHAMFRQLTDLLRRDAQTQLDGAMSFDSYAPRLAQYGGVLLRELHTHHHVEDEHYFPQLITLESRLEAGFDLLEKDHGEMDGLLHAMADAANAVLQKGEAEVGHFASHFDRFAGLLDRHLTDEEEIVVPVILKSGFNG